MIANKKEEYHPSDLKFLELLAQKFPTVAEASTEIINLEAIQIGRASCRERVSSPV